MRRLQASRHSFIMCVTVAHRHFRRYVLLMQLKTHDRYDYVPLRGRADYCVAGGRRLAVYFALNLEHFSYGEGLGAELAPGGPQPDILNFAWRDYGNRVGALGTCSTPLTPSTCRWPRWSTARCTTMRRASWRLIAGTWATRSWATAAPTPSGRAISTRQTARARLRSLEHGSRLTGRPSRVPKAALGSWISAASHRTPDLLAEAGYRYLLDWCMDDQPSRSLAAAAAADHGGALSAGE